ncbi:MAG: flagellin, partial [Syntrophorhabdales bacterium]
NYQTANLQTMDTNTQAAESAIKDTNYAKTMSDFTRYQIATQAGVAMLSQADQLPQQILTLLKNG